MAVQKVAIIGAGVSGLTSIKSCLESGLEPTCFEQRSWLGGLWNYCEQVAPNVASVHDCTITNTCKQTTCFSDFPMPLDYPNYMPHRLMHKYIETYTERFQLQQYISFNTKVLKLSKSADHAETGKWIVSYRCLAEDDSEVHEETFDAVMVGNGHLWVGAKPEIPGTEKFKGVQIHSGDYRTYHPFVGKRVVVIGCSSSGGDIACELSQHASKVFLSTRSGCYMFQRVGAYGRPPEFALSRFTNILPMSIQRAFASGLQNNFYDFNNVGLEPTRQLGVQFPHMNDELIHRVASGGIAVRDDIREITETSVTFITGETIENIDALIYGTGFQPSFPFAKELIAVKEDWYTSLYKHMFVPEVEKNTLAIIGGINSPGPVFALIEMQSRVAVQVFMKKCFLPDKNVMSQEIRQREENCRKIGWSKYNFTRVNYCGYLDELSAMIGAKPDLWSLFKEDPKLALRCVFTGPIVPAQYRLQGPHAWPDARNTIMTIEEQYQYPLKTRKCQRRPTNTSRYIYFVIFVLMACTVIFYQV